MKKWAFAFSTLTATAACFAQTGNPQTLIELSAESSYLSNGSPDWRYETLRVARKLSPRDVKELTLSQTQRFGLDDQQISGLYATPLSDKVTAVLSASISPSHRVLARHGADATLQYEFAPAWLAHAGLSNRRYNTVNVNQASLTLEHYFSSFSLAATWRPARALDTNASSAELRGTYYYGSTNSIGFIASSGQEATTVNANTVLLADVRTAALLGRHWLSPQWAINYAVARTLQGSFYNRNSVHLGAEYIF